MEWLKSFFTQPGAARLSKEEEDPTLVMDNVHDSLEALQDKLLHQQQMSHNFLKEARALKAQGKASEAMALMRRRQAVELRIRQMQGQIENTERILSTMDSTATAADLALLMRNGMNTMQHQLSQVSLDEVETLADDLNETMIQAHELGDALSRPMGLSSIEDPEEVDAKILREMEGWDEEAQDRQAREVMERFPSSSTPILANGSGRGGGGGGNASHEPQHSHEPQLSHEPQHSHEPQPQAVVHGKEKEKEELVE